MSLLNSKAPLFSLLDAQGQQVHLADLLKKGPAVVYFYPKNDTPGCTKEACGFRDAFSAFVDEGCQVVGISQDSAASHRKFADKHKLPFLLLTDSDGSVARAWGIKKMLGLLPGRETFLLDQEGVVRNVVSGHLSVDRHVQQTLQSLRDLTNSKANAH